METCFAHANIPVQSNGKEKELEEYVRTDNGESVVKIDPHYYRPSEVDVLLGDPSKAKAKLGWQPSTSFENLVKEMMDYDMEQVHKELYGSRGKK